MNEIKKNAKQKPEPSPDAWVSRHPVHGTDAYMLSEYWVDVLNREIQKLTKKTLVRCGIVSSVEEKELDGYIRDFRSMYKRRPIDNNHGGAGFSNMYWLYIIARIINPELIIESGVWRGQSTWVLREACPNAELHAFDICLKNLVVKARDVIYHEEDWRGAEWGEINPDKSLIHFDDHVNQAGRIREAYERKFRHLLFDDNLPAYQIFKDTPLIIPTIDMVYDPLVTPGSEFEWYNGNTVVSVRVDDTMEDVKSRIKYWENLPTIDPEQRADKARLGGPSKFAYVELNRGE